MSILTKIVDNRPWEMEINSSKIKSIKPKNLDEIKEELSRINIENRIILGTGSYSNIKSGNTVSITGDGGNAWGYFGPAYKKLATKYYLWEYYDKNPDHLSDDEIIDWYIKEYYDVKLRNLDAYTSSAVKILTLLNGWKKII